MLNQSILESDSTFEIKLKQGRNTINRKILAVARFNTLKQKR